MRAHMDAGSNSNGFARGNHCSVIDANIVADLDRSFRAGDQFTGHVQATNVNVTSQSNRSVIFNNHLTMHSASFSPHSAVT